MRKPVIAFAFVAASLALAIPAVPVTAARNALGVLPDVSTRGTLPGRTVEETITIVNRSDTDFNVSSTLTPLEVDADGSFSSVESSSSLPSAAGWGFVEPGAFLLARGHSADVRIGFTPPKNTRPQGYYAAVRFVGAAPSGARTTNIHAVLLEIGGDALQRSAKVTGLSAPARSLGSSIPVSLRLENTGNVAVMASGKVTLRDSLSRVTAVVPVTRTPVLPGHPRTIRLTIPAPIVPGGVRVSADIGFGPGVARDSATTTTFAVMWWHIAVAALVLFVLLRAILWFVRRRRRKKAAKRSRPSPVAVPEPVAARMNGAPVAAAKVSSRLKPILADDELQSFWEEKPSIYQPISEPEPEPEETEIAEPVLLFDPEPEPAFVDPEAEPEPEPEAEPEPEPEFEPAAVAEPVVLAPVPEAPAEPEVSPQPVAAQDTAEEEAAGARVSRLVDRVKAGIPEGPPGGPQAGLRRARVALELMTEHGARSVERIDVGLSLLRWARGDDAVAAVEDAFDEAARAGKKSALAALALAMVEVGSPRATEALLRAYAAAPRTLASRLRDTLRNFPQDELRGRGELLDALPEDRRSALKVG